MWRCFWTSEKLALHFDFSDSASTLSCSATRPNKSKDSAASSTPDGSTESERGLLNTRTCSSWWWHSTDLDLPRRHFAYVPGDEINDKNKSETFMLCPGVRDNWSARHARIRKAGDTEPKKALELSGPIASRRQVVKTSA